MMQGWKELWTKKPSEADKAKAENAAAIAQAIEQQKEALSQMSHEELLAYCAEMYVHTINQYNLITTLADRVNESSDQQENIIATLNKVILKKFVKPIKSNK